MPNVTKTGDGTLVFNTLVIRVVTIILQKYPGDLGPDADRAIADAPYTVYNDGVDLKIPNAKTGPDGSITLVVPAGIKVEVETLGSRYEIKILDKIEDLAKLEGAQRRLIQLGYPINKVDGNNTYFTDSEMLRFQADQGLDTTGVYDSKTQKTLSAIFGE